MIITSSLQQQLLFTYGTALYAERSVMLLLCCSKFLYHVKVLQCMNAEPIVPLSLCSDLQCGGTDCEGRRDYFSEWFYGMNVIEWIN